MAGMLFPDIGGALSAGSQAGAASAQNQYLMKDRAARDEIAPLIPRALQGDKEALGQIGARHPDTAMKLAPLLERLDASQRAKAKETADYITSNGMAILSAPADQQAGLYARVRAEAAAQGRNVSTWPTQYDPGWVKFNVDKAMTVAEFGKRNAEQPVPMPPLDGGGVAPPSAGPDGSVIDRASAASKKLESGGRYDAVGPVVNDKGNRAYGAHQVMDFNIGPWTQEVLGQAMTPQQFLASPQAQDAVYKAKMGQYIQKYGSPEAGARAWFAGEGGMNNPGAKDVLGTTVQAYGDRFAQAYGPGATGGAQPPGIAQGSDMPAGDGSGNALPPAQQNAREILTIRQFVHSRIPGASPLTVNGFPAYDKNGRLGIQLPNGQRDFIDVPKPKEPGADKGLYGDSLTGRALQVLRTADPGSQDYAAARAILSKPQMVPDGRGGFDVIQPMDLSMYPPATYGGGGGQPAPSGPAPGGTPQVPGGPTITKIPGAGKPLDNSARDELTKASGGVLELTELVKSFDPSFGGFILEGKGDADNWMKRNLPDGLGGADPKGQAQWWQRYKQFANLERNKLFGAALTPGEAAAFNEAMINPGMKPDEINKNLTRQRDVATKALSRIVNSMVAGGYNPQAIEAATGIPVADLPSAMGGVPQGAPPATTPAPAPVPQQQPAPQTPSPAERGRSQFDLKKKYGLE